MQNEQIDPKTLTDKEIKQAISDHCSALGSKPYYYADEVERWRADPDGLVVYRDAENGKLRAYHRGSKSDPVNA